ncbi:DUF1761 domain-containing protein [Fulvivirgaceae bacterium BMA12]|uniref:DUF1761 domain-containing protein n=1 Tax=Agaribacillus aureus TaxID=3051825 RepID=A0ABT8L9Y8_9BACT|nr:DUF1761 domain-containing protein [Fulvivirgaceae bacterium BMA12]
MEFASINFLAVLVSAIVSFALGALWYSPALFGKTWQLELGFSDEDLKGANMGKIFGSSFVLMLIMGLGMAMLIQGHFDQEITWLSGLKHGIYIGLVFVGASMGINMLYQRKSLKLWFIDAGYQIVFLGIMGAILGAWD